MHGQRETSPIPRLTVTLLHALFLVVAGWIYFGGGTTTVFTWLGADRVDPGSPGRRELLFAFGVVLFVRMGITLFVLLRRRFDWGEVGGVAVALFTYQVVFALLGARAGASPGFVDILAVGLFLLGSGLNTGSEWQRRRFKADPAHRGQLYTGGLFRLARHINYFGDTLWVTAWAITTRNIWSAVVPVALALGFVFAFIPSLSRHLRAHYGDQYEEWVRRTKAFIPFIY